MKVTQKQLIEILAELRGCTTIHLESCTEPKFKAGFPYAGRILKVSSSSALINFIYQNSVNTARRKEGKPADFIAEPRSWGVRLSSTTGRYYPLIHGDKTQTPIVDQPTLLSFPLDKLYLECKITSSESQYLLDNQPITNSLIAQAVKDFAREKDNGGRQGLDKPVIPRDYKISSLRAIKLKGNLYEIERNNAYET